MQSMMKDMTLICFFFMVISNSCADGAACVAEDRDSLLQFKSELANSSGIATWVREDCCIWDGVSCSAAGRVVGLNLSKHGLSGAFRSGLMSLELLETLELADNNLSGPIPPGLASLNSLKFLSLSRNDFTEYFPPELWVLKELRHLDVSGNKLSGPIHPPSDTRTTHSDLRESALNGLASSIEFLDMSMNSLQGGFPSFISSFSMLNYLNLSCNNLSSSLEMVDLSRLEHLAVIDLRSNKLHGSLFPLVSTIRPRAFRHLDLSANHLSGFLPVEIGRLVNSTFIELSDNWISGELPSSLGNLIKLQFLDLSGNNVTGSIPASLSRCSRLNWIKLSNNSLSGGIPSELGLLKRMHTFSAFLNNLTGTIPEALSNCTSLVVLDLCQNSLEGSFPAWTRNLKKLKVLNLGKNRLHGKIESGIFSKLVNLQVVHIPGNRFVGPIPDDFRGFHKMNVSQVLYKDQIYVTVKNQDMKYPKLLVSFSSLDLSGNRFSESIPSSITLLTGLVYLNLSNNTLTGRIPEHIGKMTELEALDLSGNELTGEIPSGISSLDSLGVLNLSRNNLSGRIPPGAHMDTFESSCYRPGNQLLCGGPLLDTSCHHSEVQNSDSQEEEDELISWIGFGIGAGIGFGLTCSLLMTFEGSRSWILASRSRREAPLQHSRSSPELFGILTSLRFKRWREILS